MTPNFYIKYLYLISPILIYSINNLFIKIDFFDFYLGFLIGVLLIDYFFIMIIISKEVKQQ
jgi:hypothetical protein